VTKIETTVVISSIFTSETLVKVLAMPGIVAVITLAACSTMFNDSSAIIIKMFLNE
jgi:hypothetical protein